MGYKSIHYEIEISKKSQNFFLFFTRGPSRVKSRIPDLSQITLSWFFQMRSKGFDFPVICDGLDVAPEYIEYFRAVLSKENLSDSAKLPV